MKRDKFYKSCSQPLSTGSNGCCSCALTFS